MVQGVYLLQKPSEKAKHMQTDKTCCNAQDSSQVITGLKRGELAKAAGVSVETVRFYESKGLIPEPPRTSSGYRLYPERTVDRLQFVLNAKNLGFSLRQIASLLDLRSEGAEDCHSVRNQILQQIAEVDEKIGDLLRIRKSLEHLSHICDGSDPMNECPILDFLQQHKE